jgi:hypothetical protein
MATSDHDDGGSPYLARPPRSLKRACADIAGCDGTAQQECRVCPVVELCPSPAGPQAVTGAAPRPTSPVRRRA